MAEQLLCGPQTPTPFPTSNGWDGLRARVAKDRSSVFFAENKHFAGFESPGKSLYSSIREMACGEQVKFFFKLLVKESIICLIKGCFAV
jgi:hypothetical protein